MRVAEFESTLLEETGATDAGMKLPPYYQVSTTASLEVYVVPDSSESSESVPAPPTDQPQ